MDLFKLTEDQYQSVFEYTKELLRSCLNKENGDTQESVAKKCGVDKSVISKYLSDARGEAIQLRTWLKIIKRVGGPSAMAEVARLLGDEDAALMLELTATDRDFVRKLRKVAKRGGKNWEKIKSEVDFFASDDKD